MLYNLNLIESYLVHGNNINLIEISIGFKIVGAGDIINNTISLHLNFGLKWKIYAIKFKLGVVVVA
jgi:hypothetical protein